MSDALNISRPGQANKTGDILTLYKDQIVGHLITPYANKLKLSNFIQKEKITNAKSAEFMLIGNSTARYAAAGTELRGSSTIAHNKVLIPLDNFLTDDIFVAEDDEYKWVRDDIQAQYMKKLGESVAKKKEANLFCVTINAARSSSPITGESLSGTVIKNTAMATDGAVLGAALFTAAKTLMEKNIDLSDVKCFLAPSTYILLAQKLDYLNKMYGGSGAIKDGTIFSVAGIQIEVTNCMPTGSVSADSLQRGTAYAGDFSNTVALICSPQAAAQVEAIPLRLKVEPQPLKHGTMLLASELGGAGIVNPAHAIELSKASS